MQFHFFEHLEVREKHLNLATFLRLQQLFTIAVAINDTVQCRSIYT